MVNDRQHTRNSGFVLVAQAKPRKQFGNGSQKLHITGMGDADVRTQFSCTALLESPGMGRILLPQIDTGEVSNSLE